MEISTLGNAAAAACRQTAARRVPRADPLVSGSCDTQRPDAVRAVDAGVMPPIAGDVVVVEDARRQRESTSACRCADPTPPRAAARSCCRRSGTRRARIAPATRRVEVGPVLILITQAQLDGQVVAQPPVVLDEQRQIAIALYGAAARRSPGRTPPARRAPAAWMPVDGHRQQPGNRRQRPRRCSGRRSAAAATRRVVHVVEVEARLELVAAA